MRAGLLAFAGLFAYACYPRNEVAIPRLDFAAKSLIVAVDGSRGLSVEALDDPDIRGDRTLEDGATITLLYYRTTLIELQIPHGVLARARDSDPNTRLLPRPDAIEVMHVEGQAFGFVATSTLGPPLDSFRIARALPTDCLAAGGCFVGDTSLGALCETPCPDTTVPTAPASPASAAMPAAPEFACAMGWTSTVVERVQTCAPMRIVDPPGPPCPLGQARFFGDPTCRIVGDPCGTDDWSMNLPPAAHTLYVRPGAAGGDGSRALPFGTIAAALPHAVSGDVVALAKGTYAEAVPVTTASVAIAGACALSTKIVAPPMSWAFWAAAPGVKLSNVTFALDSVMGQTPASDGIVLNQPGATVDVYGVIVEGAVGAGVAIANATAMTGRDLVLSRNGFTGMQISEGANVFLSDVVAEDNAVAGFRFTITIMNGAPAAGRLDRMRAVGTRAVPSGPYPTGAGLIVESGSAVIVNGAELEANTSVGILLAAEGSTATVSDVFIRDTQTNPFSSLPGRGVVVEEGAHFTGARMRLSGNVAAGISIVNAKSAASLTDILIEDTAQSAVIAGDGSGISVFDGGALDANRLIVVRSHAFGLDFANPGTRASLRNVFVRDTQPFQAVDGAHGGWGLHAFDRAEVALSGVVLAHNFANGLVASSTGTKLVAADLEVADISGIGGGCAEGISLQFGTEATLSRVQVTGVAGSSMVIRDVEKVTIEDATIEPTTLSNCYGQGILIDGASVSMTRAHVLGASENAVNLSFFQSHRVSTATISDLVIEKLTAFDPRMLPTGLEVTTGMSLNLSRAVIDTTDGRGIEIRHLFRPDLYPAPYAKLQDLVVHGTNQEGLACINPGTIDVKRAVFEQNGTAGVSAVSFCVMTMDQILVTKTTNTSSHASGMFFNEEVEIDVSNFVVEHSDGEGVRIPHINQLFNANAHVHLRSGEVRNNHIGLSFDEAALEPLLDDVAYHDNATPWVEMP
jgi:hypothetical protein